MIYRETYSGKRPVSDNDFSSETYYFDVGSEYLLNVGGGHYGATQKKLFFDHHKPIKEKQYKNYKLERINMKSVPKEYPIIMIRWVFERHMER
jgi:hypothetical protein